MGSPFYASPVGHDPDLYLDGKCKVYRMAFDGGVPTIEVESYFGKGVSVYYAPVGVTYCWPWKDRGKAWDFARARKQHIAYAQAGGKYARF